MPSTNRFAKNIGYYTLGTLSTRLLQFLFVPLYTKYISTGDMGTYDYILACVSVALPLLFQSIWEGSFRFVIETKGSERATLSTCSKYLLSLTLGYTIIFCIIAGAFHTKYAVYILLYGIGQVGSQYWLFSARALKENKLYAASSLISSSISIVLNFVLILVFHLGIDALFIATISGTFVMVAVMEYKLRLLKDIPHYDFDRALLKEVIKYATPLAINTISWWLLSSCNSVIITTTIGAESNGIYSMALRFGTILSIFTSIISLAWQEEAFRTYGEKEQDAYFNRVLSLLVTVLLGGVLVLTPVTYILYKYFVFGDYLKGVYLISFIYTSAVFNALTNHLGSAFLARKESSKIFYTTLLGGAVSVITSISLVYVIGIVGVALAMLVGNMTIFIIRIPILNKRIRMQVGYGKILLLMLLIVIVSICCYYCNMNMVGLLLITLISTALFVWINNDFLKQVSSKLVKKFKKYN